MSLRIAGGRHRGRPLRALEGTTTRPTAARVREAVFDILLHGRPAALQPLQGARVLDAFAGTGALGLEALSRGAAHATFLERDRAALALLRANAEALGEAGRCTIVAADATAPVRAPEPAGIVLLDPPYGEAMVEKALGALTEAGWIAAGTVVVAEGAERDPFALPPGFRLVDERRYGRTVVRFLAFG